MSLEQEMNIDVTNRNMSILHFFDIFIIKTNKV